MNRYIKLCLVLVLIAPGLLAMPVFSVAGELPDFTKLVEQSSPAVVNISTTQKIKRMHKLPRGMEIPDMPEGSPWNDFFRRFFGGQGGQGGQGGPQEEYNSRSLGSGFIVDNDGYIITNYHVVKNADEIIVRLSDRRELKAKVVGSDERSDVALLKIDADNLPTVKIGNSDKIKVGEWTMAIGSPFGFDHSVSVGVVSAIGRNNLPNSNYVPFIQTDVAINPGNSGGPLFDLAGKVIGINSQIYTRTGGFMGLSFAIPINVAMNVVKQIKKTGHVTRGWLGILIQDVNRELAESFGMDKPYGAAVLKVMPDSPAKKAGFKTGDVVVKFGDREIYRSSDLPLAVGSTPVGKVVKVTVIREGKARTLRVKVAKLPGKDELASAGKGRQTVKTNRIGLLVEDIPDAQRSQQATGNRGVVVKRVEKGPAREAGIRAGDIILKLNYKDITSAHEFKKVVEKLPKNKSVPILIQRNGSPTFLALKIGKK